MSIETTVKCKEIDSNSLFKRKIIKVSSSRSFETPTKSICLKNIKQKYNLDDKLKTLNEIFIRINEEKIQKYNEDSKFEFNFNNSISYDLNKINQEESCKFCFLDFDEKRYPTSEEIETMTSISHSYSDITPLPILNFINKEKMNDKQYENYKKFLLTSIEEIEKFNNKPIMGIIPIIPTIFLKKLIDFYFKQGINSFCIDLGGSNPISLLPRIRRTLIRIKQNKTLKKCYIHGINLGVGRATKSIEVIPAKDILGLGVGFDSIGDRYKKFIPSKYWATIIKTNPEFRFRLFNKEDYGYWRGISPKMVKSIFPKDCKIDMNLFSSYKDKFFLQKLFNSEQLSLESLRLRKRIKERPEKILNYIKKKKFVIEDDFEKIRGLKNKLSKLNKKL